MKQAYNLPVVFSLLVGLALSEGLKLEQLLRRQPRELSLDRFLEITAVEDLAAHDPNFVANVRERYLTARAKLQEMQRNENLTFDVDFMPFHLWSAKKLESLNGAVPLDADIEHDTHSRVKRDLNGYEYAYVNYTKEGFVTPVKDQSSCGSCYAFAAIGTIESALAKSGKGVWDLSEQQAVACTYREYRSGLQKFNNGCNGGNSQFIMDYFKKTAVQTENDIPYNIPQLKLNPACPVESQPQKYKFDYAYVQPKSENHLAYMLNNNGPVTIFIHGSSSALQAYKGGIFNAGISCTGTVNHAVLLTGLVKIDGQELWIVKNSWGTAWGDNGYVLFPKGQNMCNMISAPVTTANIDSTPVV